MTAPCISASTAKATPQDTIKASVLITRNAETTASTTKMITSATMKTYTEMVNLRWIPKCLPNTEIMLWSVSLNFVFLFLSFFRDLSRDMFYDL